ncbi:uncharacterized protein LOC131215349 [Anopheles bellator]|uniref:uncharacterized protein LOC131215349 n=1 Tax=Anopheles bellator TaxID=139047 RepID=UPI0026484A14|nr:uncharacterized protein LOC131215349 [Anopheles bellator]
MVVAEGQKYAKILGVKKFKGSNKWLNTFLKKYKISFRISKTLVPSVAEQYFSVVNLIAQYSARDVFAASETGLFFQCLPSDFRALRQKLCQSGSLPEQRLTIVCAANKDGSEKLPLLVIGNDNCFSHMESIIYRSNPKSWITWYLFRDWIMELDRRFAEQQRKVLLFVKECTVYPKALQAVLKAINLQFLPMKDPPLQQPLEIGVIQILKKHYRIELLKHTSQHTGTEMICSNVAVPCGEMLACAWYTRVRRSTIQTCFKNANYPMNDVDAFESNIADCIVDAHEKQYESAEWFFDYNKVDQHLITYGRMSDADILDCAQAHKTDNIVTCPVEEEAEDVSIEGSDHDEAMNERSEHTADDDSKSESETRYQQFQGQYQESDFENTQLDSTLKNGAIQTTVDSDRQYNVRDVFFVSETDLLFKSLKTNTQELEENGCLDGSLLEQCLTIMCAANMNGTEKLPLLVIGNDNLSAEGGPNALYRINAEARSNTELLREWIMLLDRKFVADHRNVLLFVEERDAHLISMQHELEAIFLHMFYSNSSLLPPLRVGVIQHFKQYYRQELFKHHPTEFAEKVDSLDITIVEGLNIVAQSWEVAVTPELIQSCFVQAGFPVCDLVRVCSVTTPCSTEAIEMEIIDESAVYQWPGESAEANNVLCNVPMSGHTTLEYNSKLHNKTESPNLEYSGSCSIPEQPAFSTLSSQLRMFIKARNKSPELSDAKRLKTDALLQESFRKIENDMEYCHDPLEDVLDSNNASPECYPEISVQPCKMEALERTVDLFIKNQRL